MKLGHIMFASAIALATVPQAASAAIIWSDLTTQGANTVSGTVGGTTVVYNGDVVFPTSTNGTGANYWVPFPSGDGPNTGPEPTDIIATSAAGLKTITFGSAVTDIYIALNSWNGQAATFSSPFTIYAQGCGYWGCGSGTASNGNLTLTASGELHGILKFSGSFTSLSYTDQTSEYWHGIQIGIGGLAGAIPEPSAWALMIVGFGAVGAGLRRRARVKFAAA